MATAKKPSTDVAKSSSEKEAPEKMETEEEEEVDLVKLAVAG